LRAFNSLRRAFRAGRCRQFASRALSASAAPISIHSIGRKDSQCGDAQNFGRYWNIFQRVGGKYAFDEDAESLPLHVPYNRQLS
jgi:hypothetical protein